MLNEERGNYWFYQLRRSAKNKSPKIDKEARTNLCKTALRIWFYNIHILKMEDLFLADRLNWENMYRDRRNIRSRQGNSASSCRERSCRDHYLRSQCPKWRSVCDGVNISWTLTPHEDQVRKAMGKGENWLEEADVQQPFGRLLRPLDIAYLVAYLLSDQAEMMTDSVIDFNQAGNVIGAWD